MKKEHEYEFRLRIDKYDSNIFLFIDGNFDNHLNESYIISIFYNELKEKFYNFFKFSALRNSHISLMYEDENIAFLNYLCFFLSKNIEFNKFQEISKSYIFFFQNTNIFTLIRIINRISDDINDIDLFKNYIITLYNKKEIDNDVLVRIIKYLNIQELNYIVQAKNFDII